MVDSEYEEMVTVNMKERAAPVQYIPNTAEATRKAVGTTPLGKLVNDTTLTSSATLVHSFSLKNRH